MPAWYSTGCVSLVKHIIASRSSSGVAATSATTTMGIGREGQATQSDEPDGEADDDGDATAEIPEAMTETMPMQRRRSPF